MKIKCDLTILLYNRRFILIALLCIFLIYCAYVSSACFPNSLLSGTKFLGKIFIPSDPSIGQSGDNEDDETTDGDLLNSPQSEVIGRRTRSCANELRNYTSSREVGLGNRQLPVALIIGVKKSGTRALLEFIRQHPSVRASGCEVHYFDRHYNKGLRWYRHRMPVSKEGQITMEKTPSYFITREVPKRVYNMNPKTKLLLVVRDPVTRAISDYTQAVTKLMTTKKFEELAFVNGSTGLVNIKWGPLKIGLYCRHLQRWLQYFHLSQFLFISGERLITDPAEELQRVEDFLGLKPVITERNFYFNATKGFPCILRTTSQGKAVPHCLGKTKGRSHPLIDPIALDRLRQFYRPFNRRFYEMTGFNFGWL